MSFIYSSSVIGPGRLRSSSRGSAIVTVVLIVGLLMVASLAFLKRSSNFLSMGKLHKEAISVELQLNDAQVRAKNKLKRAVDGIILSGKLRFVNGPTYETFNNISNQYASNSLSFLQGLVKQQAYSGSGTLNSAHEFSNFDTAFPTSWTDLDTNDGQYFEVKYTFTPISMYSQNSPALLRFDYEYRIQARAYGQESFQKLESDDAGEISVELSGASFSQWTVFMNSMRNQNGSLLVFAGGNTSAQIQEVYAGPVHVNSTPYFYGHPVFTDVFTSTAATSSWVNYNVSGYSCCADFQGGSQGSVASISMPTQIFNTLRLAAGDTSNNAATNNTTVTNAELRGFLATHATGTVSSGSTALPGGIYIPVDNSTSLNPTGGIYVEGDAKVKMNVVQGSTDFNSTQWSQMQTAHKSCKFQKISVTSMTSGVAARDVYIADDPCDVTYVYNATTPASSPVVLNGRINGNLHVNGKIDELGGESRTRPAIATDFGFTVSAQKDVRIINDLQYEDVSYVTQAADGTQGSTTVADAYGSVGGSGISPTAQDIAPKISSDSHTILGIVSVSRNVMIHTSAPANINIQGAIFAGNSAAYNSSTGLGCGSSGANTQGCGFGYEAYSTATGMGAIKFLGSLAEYKDQTTGVLASPPRGYASRFYYDTRFRQKLMPPAFPISDSPNATAVIRPYKTFRISKATP